MQPQKKGNEKTKRSNVLLKLLRHLILQSSVFFCRTIVEANILADQGADTNLMSAHLLENIWQKTAGNRTTILSTAQLYRRVRGDTCLRCHKEVVLDVHLRLLYLSSFILRNIILNVTREVISTPVIKRRVPEPLDFVNR